MLTTLQEARSLLEGRNNPLPNHNKIIAGELMRLLDNVEYGERDSYGMFDVLSENERDALRRLFSELPEIQGLKAKLYASSQTGRALAVDDKKLFDDAVTVIRTLIEDLKKSGEYKLADSGNGTTLLSAIIRNVDRISKGIEENTAKINVLFSGNSVVRTP